jgi:hypothetical protein
MRERQIAGRPNILLAVLAGAGLLLAGCNASVANPGGAPAAPAADGKAALAGALTGLAVGDYTFKREGGHPIEGIVHLPESAQVAYAGNRAAGAGAATFLQVGAAHYLKYDLWGPGAATMRAHIDEAIATSKDKKDVAEAKLLKKWAGVLTGEQWARFDPARLHLPMAPTLPTAQASDITGASALAAAVVTAQRAGDIITGTLDATRVDPALSLFNTGDPVDELFGPKGRALPFTATLDAQGRLSNLTVDVPDVAQTASMKADNPTPDPSAEPFLRGFQLIIKIADYGTAQPPAAPPGAQDLPAEIYAHITDVND